MLGIRGVVLDLLAQLSVELAGKAKSPDPEAESRDCAGVPRAKMAPVKRDDVYCPNEGSIDPAIASNAF